MFRKRAVRHSGCCVKFLPYKNAEATTGVASVFRTKTQLVAAALAILFTSCGYGLALVFTAHSDSLVNAIFAGWP
jgi:hypothetical protein